MLGCWHLACTKHNFSALPNGRLSVLYRLTILFGHLNITKEKLRTPYANRIALREKRPRDTVLFASCFRGPSFHKATRHGYQIRLKTACWFAACAFLCFLSNKTRFITELPNTRAGVEPAPVNEDRSYLCRGCCMRLSSICKMLSFHFTARFPKQWHGIDIR